MGMTLEDIYTTRSGVPAGPAQSSPNPGVAVAQQVSSPVGGGPNAASIGSVAIAPAVVWVTLFLGLVVVRLLWEKGARPGESIAGGG